MMERYIELITHNNFVRVVLLWIVLDTILGCLRAIKHHKFNSAFGIDGAIRKTAMVLCVLFLLLVDLIVGVNVITWLPDSIKQASGLVKIGIGEFFCILFLLYESISILKNLYLCGCPTPKWLKTWLEKILNEMTGELEEKQEEKA